MCQKEKECGVQPHSLGTAELSEGSIQHGECHQEGGTIATSLEEVPPSVGVEENHQEGETIENHQEGESGKILQHSSSAEVITEEVWMNELDEDLFQKGRDKVKQSRSEKRAEKRRREQLQLSEPPIEVVDLRVSMETDRHDVDISSTMLKELQATDPTLKKIRESVSVRESEFGVGFYFRDGLIYRRWIPAGREGDVAAVEQLVLPQKCRRTVMMLAHSIPMAGHLGKDETAKRVLQRFYWPTLYQDVAKFCQCCGECQKATGRRQVRAPLIP